MLVEALSLVFIKISRSLIGCAYQNKSTVSEHKVNHKNIYTQQLYKMG